MQTQSFVLLTGTNQRRRSSSPGNENFPRMVHEERGRIRIRGEGHNAKPWALVRPNSPSPFDTNCGSNKKHSGDLVSLQQHECCIGRMLIPDAETTRHNSPLGRGKRTKKPSVIRGSVVATQEIVDQSGNRDRGRSVGSRKRGGTFDAPGENKLA